jgi:hypothetical protein
MAEAMTIRISDYIHGKSYRYNGETGEYLFYSTIYGILSNQAIYLKEKLTRGCFEIYIKIVAVFL